MERVHLMSGIYHLSYNSTWGIVSDIQVTPPARKVRMLYTKCQIYVKEDIGIASAICGTAEDAERLFPHLE